MASSKRGWENEPSTEGLGLIQGLLGVPNDPFLSKGELSLRQQERIASSVESIASRVSDREYQVLVNTPDNTQVLGRIESNLADGLRDFTHNLSEMDQRRSMQEADQRHFNREMSYLAQQTAEGIFSATLDISDDTADIADGVRQIVNQTSGVQGSLNGIGSTLNGLLSNSYSLTISGRETNRGIAALNKNSELQVNILGEVHKAILDNGTNVEILLEELTNIAIQQLVAQQRTAAEMKDLFNNAVTQIIYGLTQFRKELSKELRDIKDSVDKVEKTTREVRDRIVDNTNAIQQNTASSRDLA